MQIKKFEAQNMSEALRLIKQEFGADAVILSVRKIENGKSILGLSRGNGVEVTAATDVQPANMNVNNSAGQYAKYRDRQYDRSDFASARRKKSFISSLREGTRRFDKRKSSSARKVHEKNRDSKRLYSAYHQMLDQDVDETVALKLTREVSQFLITNSPLYKKGFKQCLVNVLNENGIFASPVKIAREKQKLVAFIGSTGVGKTTTIAKLAAAAKTREEKKHVALITLDENRIGAIEQLKIYAKIIGVPLKAASSKTELKRYVEKLNKYDLIFIDTPGISQTNQDQLNELHDIFTRVHDVEFQLVLSAGTNDKTLSDVVKKYGVFNISRLMFTKLDEAITYGSILNQLYRSKIPVSYFTNGQQVPENIEAAKIEKLADLLFNEKDNKNYLIGSPEELARNIIEFENKLTGTDDESGTYSNENGFENARRYIVHPNVYGEKKFNSYRY